MSATAAGLESTPAWRTGTDDGLKEGRTMDSRKGGLTPLVADAAARQPVLRTETDERLLRLGPDSDRVSESASRGHTYTSVGSGGGIDTWIRFRRR